MNSVERFIDFLDDNQDKLQETTFIKDFCDDREFRESFRQYITLTKTLNESSKYFVPSDEIRRNVFNSLGLVATTSSVPVKTFRLSKMFAVTATAIAAFMLGYAVSSYNPNSWQYDDSGLYSGREIEFINSTDDLLSKFSSKPFIGKSSHGDVNRTQLSYSGEKETFMFDDEESSLILASNLYEAIPDNKPDFEFSGNKIIDPDKQYDTLMIIRSSDEKFGFEFKNTPSWFSKDPIVQPYELNRFNNLSISLLYPIFDGLKIGADFRQETFYLEYEGFNSRDQNVFIYQQPNLSSYSLFLRYNPFDIGSKLKPFVQFNGGFNKFGYTTREMIGIEYYPFDNVYIIAGAEFNQLFFKHDAESFTSNKFSLNYGLGVKF